MSICEIIQFKCGNRCAIIHYQSSYLSIIIIQQDHYLSMYMIIFKLHTASFLLSVRKQITLHKNISRFFNMALLNSGTTRELARLGADFASINISNNHVTHSQERRESQIPEKNRRKFVITSTNWKQWQW